MGDAMTAPKQSTSTEPGKGPGPGCRGSVGAWGGARGARRRQGHRAPGQNIERRQKAREDADGVGLRGQERRARCGADILQITALPS